MKPLARPEDIRQQERYLHLVQLMRRKRIRAILIAQAGRCFYCPRTINMETTTFDHVIPKSKGGRGGPNLVGACRLCNHEKGDMSAEEFERARRPQLAIDGL